MVHESEHDKCNWFPRTDTLEHAEYDKRTPGLFKVEWKEKELLVYAVKLIIALGVGKIKLVAKE